MRTVAFILARRGSKRLPGKNMKMLNGHPMIYWTIKAARDALCVDTVFVSSDDEAVLDYADAWDDPKIRTICRPAELCDDKATIEDGLMHAIRRFGLEYFDVGILLQPTSPLRNCYLIEKALQEFTGYNTLTSVNTEGKHNGAVYIFRIRNFVKDKNLYAPSNYTFEMGKADSIDIDTIEDFKKAEEAMRGQSLE